LIDSLMSIFKRRNAHPMILAIRTRGHRNENTHDERGRHDAMDYVTARDHCKRENHKRERQRCMDRLLSANQR